MLVIASDLHLGDGTTANSIAPGAFQLFSNRLRETAYYASFRKDGTYRPVESLDLVLLGDILDPLHSTLWLDTAPSDKNYTRPWTDFNSPFFAAKLAQTTQPHKPSSMKIKSRWRSCVAVPMARPSCSHPQMGAVNPIAAQRNASRPKSAYTTWWEITIGTITSKVRRSMRSARP
jgi:hypothetical protein